MPIGHRSARQRRRQRGRVARIAVPVAISVALAVVAGVIVAAVHGTDTNVSESALSNCASPAAYVVPAATGTDTQAPATTGTGSTVPATSGTSGQAAATAGTNSAASATAGTTSSAAPATAGTASQTPAATGTGTQAPDATAGTSSQTPATAGTSTATQAPTTAGTAGTASAPPCPSASATATAPAVNPEAGRPDLAEANPVDPTGNAISLNQTAAEAANSLNCTLIVPANPLSARGLAAPWQLSDGCSEANPNEEAFVESTILAPNGKLTVYDPLVITQGTTAAVTPKAPAVPRGAQVIINVGFNGNNLVLEGRGAFQGGCIDAFGNSIIAQTSACNAAAFYADANAQIARGRLRVPRLGTASDGQACESTESFSLIDQDQSDNVLSGYLLNGNGQTAQDTAANKNAMGDATVIANGSDNGLLGHFVDPALGCTPFTAPDATSPNGKDGSQALNTLSALKNSPGTRALLPVNDPQLLVAGQFSIGKTNTYRTLNDQPLLSRNTSKNQNAATYCQNMVNLQPAKLQLDMGKEADFTSPVPATGNNLATFLGARLSASFTNLNCQNFGLNNPVAVTTDGNGVATAVTYTLTQQTATVPSATPSASATPSGNGHHWGGTGYNRSVPHGRHGHKENGAGM